MKQSKALHVRASWVNSLVFLKKQTYVQDGSIAIFAEVAEGEDKGAPEFIATVCLDEKPSDGCVWLKGWTENEGIPEDLESAGVVMLTNRINGATGAVEALLLESDYLL